MKIDNSRLTPMTLENPELEKARSTFIGGDTINPSHHPAIVLTGDSRTGFSTVGVRNEDPLPFDFRFAEYPDGSRRLQGGYRWSEGLNAGITWRDVPMVKVDEPGEELTDEG